MINLAATARFFLTVKQFQLTTDYSLETVPSPINRQVNLVVLPNSTFAMQTYLGLSTYKNFVEHRAQQQQALAGMAAQIAF